jgi:hypothetical protein
VAVVAAGVDRAAIQVRGTTTISVIITMWRIRRSH